MQGSLPRARDSPTTRSARQLDARGRRVRRSWTTTTLLADGSRSCSPTENVVGWFQGRMEFGPRALGGRSIIGDPRSAEDAVGR